CATNACTGGVCYAGGIDYW
nr:immunoglobulin heavy chain junction region [Macaca mulatta]MOY22426.1 immunoglobulin heavy chain junction region [Macaca mulatta]